MDYDALHLIFYVVIGLTGLVLILAVGKVLLRNVPLWLFELWPHLLGLGVAVYCLLAFGWPWALVAAGVGLAMGVSWTAMLDHCRKKGRERSRLERIHAALVKWAQK